jgi:hypothetical protein
MSEVEVPETGVHQDGQKKGLKNDQSCEGEEKA